MVGDARQGSAEVKRWIDSAEFGCTNEGVERGGALTARIGTKEQVILPSDRDGAERPFRGAVVDLQQTIIDVARESTPVGKCIPDRARGVALAGQRLPHL